jgi:DNA polymerase III subunit epsilon
MREIVFDTETTGLDPRIERVIEIGAIELENRFPTGRTFHHYINADGRPIDPEATRIHGITEAQLIGKPVFGEIIDAFLAFVGDGVLVAHNAGFDQGFLNAEFNRLNRTLIPDNRYIDTLAIARRKHPMGPNSLDALCKRYGIDNSRRIHHGALLDSELLAEVYIEMAGGRQAALGLSPQDGSDRNTAARKTGNGETDPASERLPQRPQALPLRLSDNEKAAHDALVNGLGETALWRRYA